MTSQADETHQARTTTAEQFEIVDAPDLSTSIWQKHQRKRMIKRGSAASLIVAMLLGWQIFLPPSETENLISQNYTLEQQLADVLHSSLSMQQQMLIETWLEEIELLDTNQMSLQTRPDQDYWCQRVKLLNQIMEFSNQPLDIVEV